MRGLAWVLLLALTGLALGPASVWMPAVQAALPPINPPPPTPPPPDPPPPDPDPVPDPDPPPDPDPLPDPDPPPPPIDPLPDPDPVPPPEPPPTCQDQPEPASITLLALGGGLVALRAWRRRQSGLKSLGE